MSSRRTRLKAKLKSLLSQPEWDALDARLRDGLVGCAGADAACDAEAERHPRGEGPPSPELPGRAGPTRSPQTPVCPRRPRCPGALLEAPCGLLSTAQAPLRHPRGSGGSGTAWCARRHQQALGGRVGERVTGAHGGDVH